MTQEEILDYNKLCAEFLGWNKYREVFYRIPTTLQEHQGIKQDIPTEGLVFNSDWNWIMEVVEAIEKLGYNRRVDIDSSHILIQYKEWYTLVQKNSKKEAVVQAINQFLIWYNENK